MYTGYKYQLTSTNPDKTEGDASMCARGSPPDSRGALQTQPFHAPAAPIRPHITHASHSSHDT